MQLQKVEYGGGGGGGVGGFWGRGSEPKGVEGVCPPSPRWREFASSVLSLCGFWCPSPARRRVQLTPHWFWPPAGPAQGWPSSACLAPRAYVPATVVKGCELMRCCRQAAL